MANWKQDPIIEYRHELQIPNGPILELYEYTSNYKYKLFYSHHEPTENSIKNPTIKVLDEQTYTAQDLNKAKEYAEMLAKITFEKVKNNILIALKHIEFFTSDPPQKTTIPDDILWTNKIAEQEIHDQKAKELLSTELKPDYKIEQQLRNKKEQDLAELRTKLDAYNLSDYLLIEFTETQKSDFNNTPQKSQQIINRITLSEIFNQPNIDIPGYTCTYYFEDNDLYLQTEHTSDVFSPTKSIFRLIEKRFFSNNTRVILKDITINEFKDMDLNTIKMEPVIKNALQGLDYII